MMRDRLLRATRRRWPLVLGLAVAVLLVAVLPRAQGVYASEAQLTFVTPNAYNFGNALRADSTDAVAFAAAVEREFNGYSVSARTASNTAKLYGLGVTNGYSVALPNAGGQWQTNFNRAALDIQVVSGSADATRAMMEDVVSRLSTIARSLQSEQGVEIAALVTTSLAPVQPSVVFVAGSRKREVAAFLLLGLALAWTMSVAWERRLSARAR